MKRLLFILVAGAFTAMVFSSCASVKRDCNGIKHYKTKNGIYL